MTQSPPTISRWAAGDYMVLAARWILGGVFLYMGLSKAIYPVDFLKVLREYEMVDSSFFLNFLAAVLPWFEVLCGVLLVGGIAVRGSALVVLLMLIPFSLVVSWRAMDIQQVQSIPFCSVRFDCGCGGGEVVICHKLVENAGLILLSGLLLFWRGNRWCLRYHLIRPDQT